MDFVKESLSIVQNQYKIWSDTEKTVRVKTINDKRKFNFTVRNLDELAKRCSAMGLEEPVTFFMGKIDDLVKIDTRKILQLKV